MITAKQLDDAKTAVEKKRAQLSKIQEELDLLESTLREKANAFMMECGIVLKTTSTKPKSVQATPSNPRVISIVKKMIGNKKFVEIKKDEKLQIAEQAGCSVKEVEQTLKNEFQGLPLGKGRKSKFGLKNKV